MSACDPSGVQRARDAAGDERELRARVRDALAADEPGDAPAFARVYAAAQRRRAESARAAAGWTLTPLRRYAYATGGACAAIAVAVLAARTLVPAEHPPAGAAATSTPGPAATPDEPADPDYAAALALRRSMRAGTPLDALFASLPAPVTRGLPALPEYRYPLLPEGAPLAAPVTSRNPS